MARHTEVKISSRPLGKAPPTATAAKSGPNKLEASIGNKKKYSFFRSGNTFFFNININRSEEVKGLLSINTI